LFSIFFLRVSDSRLGLRHYPPFVPPLFYFTRKIILVTFSPFYALLQFTPVSNQGFFFPLCLTWPIRILLDLFLPLLFWPIFHRFDELLVVFPPSSTLSRVRHRLGLEFAGCPFLQSFFSPLFVVFLRPPRIPQLQKLGKTTSLSLHLFS